MAADDPPSADGQSIPDSVGDDADADSSHTATSKITDPAAIDVSVGDVSVFVRGAPDDDLDDIRGHFDEVFENAVETYVDHRDAGDFY